MSTSDRVNVFKSSMRGWICVFVGSDPAKRYYLNETTRKVRVESPGGPVADDKTTFWVLHTVAGLDHEIR